MRRIFATIALASAAAATTAWGCGSDPFFCANDDQCGGEGRCETDGYCSFPDDTCPSGRVYGSQAPTGIREMCVPEEGTSTDGSSGVGSSTSGTSIGSTTSSDSSTSDGESGGSTTTGSMPASCEVQWQETFDNGDAWQVFVTESAPEGGVSFPGELAIDFDVAPSALSGTTSIPTYGVASTVVTIRLLQLPPAEAGRIGQFAFTDTANSGIAFNFTDGTLFAVDLSDGSNVYEVPYADFEASWLRLSVVEGLAQWAVSSDGETFSVVGERAAVLSDAPHLISVFAGTYVDDAPLSGGRYGSTTSRYAVLRADA